MHMRKKIWLLLFSFLFLAAPPVFAEDAAVSNKETNESFQRAVQKGSDPLTEKISLDYKDADISNILRSLSYTYGLNLVTSTDVKGKMTISLKDVTLAEALDAVLSANGYNYARKGNIIYVSPGSAEGAQLTSEPIVLKYLKAADSQNFLRKVLSPKGDIKVDEVANMLIVTDFQVNIDKLKELLKSVDQAPMQVLIEAKIVDITSKDLHNLGATWTMDYKPAGDTKGLFDRATDYQEELQTTITAAGPSSTISGGQLAVNALTLKGFSASATLDALIQNQKAQLLASPSIVVLNNREARIIIGEKVPYKERTQTPTGTTETTRFIDVGTTLRVTPSINADGYITLNIHPEVSSVSSLLDAGPRITTREADTTVRVKEGETIVIGGLIKQEDNRTRSKIPILGDIPILGYLFGNRSKDQTQTELAVFITPKIMRSREEVLAIGKTPLQEEAHVNILAAGKMNLQFGLFEKASHLQHGVGLESQYKEDWQRKREALSLYENVLTQFPDGPKAAEAGYQAAWISFNDIGEPYHAKELCGTIISNYPDSPFAEKARALHEQITASLEQSVQNKQLARQEREKQEAAKKTQAEKDRLEKEQQVKIAAEKEKQAKLQEALEADKKEAMLLAQQQVKEQGRLRKEQLQKEEKDRLEKERQAKIFAEKEKQTKLEADKKAKAEQAAKAKEERLKKEQEEKDRLEKARQAKLAAEKEKQVKMEADRQAKIAAEKEKQVKLKEEQEIKAKEAARLKEERLKKEQAEKDRLEKERQDKQAKLEADKKAKAEAEAKLKEERLKQKLLQKQDAQRKLEQEREMVRIEKGRLEKARQAKIAAEKEKQAIVEAEKRAQVETVAAMSKQGKQQKEFDSDKLEMLRKEREQLEAQEQELQAIEKELLEQGK
jgi:type IV pilus assembly protein PilQ